MAIAKSAIGPTFNASVAAWLNEPWAPATLKKEGPRVAVVAADNVTDTVEPTPTVSGDCGEMLIPAGRPLIATLTFPDNPCTPVIVTLSGVLPPCANDTAVGLAAIVKSPEGGGSVLVAGLCVLMQLASVSSAMSRKTKLASRFGAVMKKFLLRHREDRALSAFLFGPAHAHAGYFSARPGHHLAVRRLPIPLHAAARPGFDFLASLHHW